MRRGLMALVVALLVGAAPAQACTVTGCGQDEGLAPVYRFRVLDSLGVQLAVFDSSTDEALTLPNFLRTALPDGSLVVEYFGEDRRAAYGDAVQQLSIQFADLLLPDKHPEGRAEQIPVGESRGVLNWTGKATYLTVSGALKDGAGLTVCGWFCELDLDWIGSFPSASPSFSRVKALY